MTPESVPGRLYTNQDQTYDRLRLATGNASAYPERWDAIETEEVQTRMRLGSALAASYETIAVGSKLLNKNAELGEHEWQEALKFLHVLSPITIKNYPLHLHVRTAAAFAEKLIDALQQKGLRDFVYLDKMTVKIQALFHDIGKNAGQFGYAQTEIESDAILEKTGMPHFIVQTVRLGDAFKRFDQLTPIEKVITYADMCSGRESDEPRRIKTYDERITKHVATRTLSDYTEYAGRMPIHDSEIDGLLCLDRGDKDRYTQLYRELDLYFKSLGVDRTAIQEEIMAEEEASEDPVLQSLRRGSAAFKPQE